MKALHRLRKLCHAVRRDATNKAEERLDSIIPASSSDHAFTVGTPCRPEDLEGCNDGIGGVEIPGCVAATDLSNNTRCHANATPVQNNCSLDGAWEASGGCVNEKMSAFIITGSIFTTADNQSYSVAFGQGLNTIMFGDSVLELATDGVAWLHFASQPSVCYKRVDLPNASFLSRIEGVWEYGGGALGSSATTLTFQGAFWYFSAGRKSGRGLVHVDGSSQAAMLLNYRIRTTASGKLLLRPPRGSALKFRCVVPRTQLWTLQE